jgi:tetratricopeptide (TPR) repeat protein
VCFPLHGEECTWYTEETFISDAYCSITLMISRILANAPLAILALATVIIAPVFFIGGLGLSFAKLSILSLGVFLALIVYLAYMLRDGSVSLPKTRVWWGVVGVFGVTILSGLFSPVPAVSFLGAGGEIGTVWSLIVFLALFAVAAFIIRSREHAMYLYIALGSMGTLLAVHYIANLIALHLGSTVLSLGVMTGTTVNLIGKWNEFGIFYGLIAVISLLVLLLGPKTKKTRLMAGGFLAVSLVMTAIVNFSIVWWSIGVFSLLLFVYMISFGRASTLEHERGQTYHVPFIPLVTLLLSVIFLLPGNLGGSISDRLSLSDVEIRPSVEGTARIAALSWQDGWKEMLIGVGPNLFSSAWIMHKPDGVNQTDAWNTDFSAGFGVIPSTAITLGVVGFLAWVLFLALFFIEGVRGIVRVSGVPHSRFGVVVSFVAATYLWIIAIIYTPGALLFGLAFLFSGATIGLLARENIITLKTISFVDDPRIGFVAVLGGVVLLIGSVTAVYGLSVRLVSGIVFRDGLVAFQLGDYDTAIADIISAVRMYEHDSYYQVLAQSYAGRLSLISVDELGQETALAQFRETLGNAITSAEAAIAYNPENYVNTLVLASVYADASQYGVDGSADEANTTYDEAAVLNPHNPEILYFKARLAAKQNDLTTARSYITEALTMKNNYTAAIFLLAQIEETEGNMDNAIRLTETASALAPLDAGLSFQLGLLKYKEKDYAGAKTAFSRAVTVVPTYNNALYFLGLSYDMLGDKEDAIAIFEELDRRIPGNDDIVSVLSRLKSGQAAVVETAPKEAPENAEEPPIEE